MRKQKFGSTEQKIGVIGQGTWGFEKHSRKAVERAVHRGIDLGMNHIDTAEMYGSGRVEKILAKVLEGVRDKVYLVSKVLPDNATYTGTIAACESSLSRLRTDRLDCYLLHWHEELPLEDTFGAFESLKSQGKIGAWGVSNFDLAQMKAAVDIAGPEVIACNQVEYHLRNRNVENGLFQWCNKNQISTVAYSPFGVKRFPARLSRQGRTLASIATKHQCSVRAVALAFLLRDPRLFVIPKAAKVRHVEDNALAADLVLDKQDLIDLDRAFPIT